MLTRTTPCTDCATRIRAGRLVLIVRLGCVRSHRQFSSRRHARPAAPAPPPKPRRTRLLGGCPRQRLSMEDCLAGALGRRAVSHARAVSASMPGAKLAGDHTRSLAGALRSPSSPLQSALRLVKSSSCGWRTHTHARIYTIISRAQVVTMQQQPQPPPQSKRRPPMPRRSTPAG